MADEQTRIDAEPEPLTWDGQPLYAPESVREQLFSPEAFEQMPGQLAIEPDVFHDRFNMHSASVRCPMCEADDAR